MHRLLTLLLLPFFVVGNSFAHTHECSAHSRDHDRRAHIHVGGNSHHDHGHHDHEHATHAHSAASEHHSSRSSRDRQPHFHETFQDSGKSEREAIRLSCDHDSDAIYLIAIEFAVTNPERAAAEGSPQVALETRQHAFVNFRAKAAIYQPFQARHPARPLYLLHAALRL